MLCQFSFKNFKSYKDETVLDLQSTVIEEFSETLLSYDKDGRTFLPVSVIYGPNGGGKSNVLEALGCLLSIVVKPINLLNKSDQNILFMEYKDCKPFAFDDNSKNEPTKFEVYFRINEYEYRYNISVFKGDIIEEYLCRRTIGGKKTATIFKRYDGKVELGSSLKKNSINTDVNVKMPLISFLAITYDIPAIQLAIDWFESCIFRNYANPISEINMMYIDNKSFKDSLIRLLNDVDVRISDYRFNEEGNKDKSFDILIEKNINDKNYQLNILEESDGTKKLFGLLPVVLMSLIDGRLMIVDELDAKLHPKLLKYIIMLFKNQKINKNRAQLIFTSHDMTTMRNDVFRRDEVWFASRNNQEASEIYSLFEIRNEDNSRVKSTAAFDKQYLEGRYGADPYLSQMLGWEV